ncbi:MAG: class I SAM-dependent methyltransferase [Acidimicrobiia bacterium]|nr:class I SAM-dependent methyltransferase [Acidimicrobiia bacterium]
MKSSIVLRALDRFISRGKLSVSGPNGESSVLGGRAPGHEAAIDIRPGTSLGAVLSGGALGIVEAYMAGGIETDDLTDFLLFAADNQQAWIAEHPRLYAIGRSLSRLRNTGETDVESMAGHYNLGNEFYESWLDPTMTYSSGRFIDTGDLEEAQRIKYRSLVELADIRPGHRVLEIGSGWGAFSLFLAEMGCDVTTLTIAEEQLAYVEKRVANSGAGDRIDARLLDFAEIQGEFERVVSVEMIESIDERRWQELFDVIARVLAPGGKLGLQSIVIDDEFWSSYRENPDFIQRYIFPGGMLPSPAVLRTMVTASGMTWTGDHAFGSDYAKTLEMWHDRFESAWESIRDLGFDERFRRMWKSYLSYCEAGFRIGRIDVVQFAAEVAS